MYTNASSNRCKATPTSYIKEEMEVERRFLKQSYSAKEDVISITPLLDYGPNRIVPGGKTVFPKCKKVALR